MMFRLICRLKSVYVWNIQSRTAILRRKSGDYRDSWESISITTITTTIITTIITTTIIYRIFTVGEQMDIHCHFHV